MRLLLFLLFLLESRTECTEDDLDCKVDNLHSTDQGEPGEESHGASNKTKLALKCDFLVPFNLVVGCWCKVELYNVQWGELLGRGCK